MRKAFLRRLPVVAVFGVVLLAAGAALAQQLTPVKIGAMPHITGAGVFVALDKGYFKKHGVEPQVSFFGSGALMVAPLAAGDLDLAIGGISAGLFNAIARGFDLKIIADYLSLAPGFGSGAMIVRKELAASGEITKMADLKGRKVAFNARGAPCHYMVGKGLESAGLKLTDVEVVLIPFPDIPTALKNKAIDAACAVDPMATQAVKSGAAEFLATLDKVTPYMQVSVLIANPKLTANSDLTRKVLAAYLEGVREAATRSPEVASIVSKYVKTPKEQLEASIWGHADLGGKVNVKSIQDQLEFYTREGLVKGTVDLTKVVDESFLPR